MKIMRPPVPVGEARGFSGGKEEGGGVVPVFPSDLWAEAERARWGRVALRVL